MSSLFDSFWRAAAYCLIPRVIVLSLVPLLLIGVIAGVSSYFFWDAAIAYVQQMLSGPGWLSGVWDWLGSMGWNHVTDYLAPLVVVLAAVPVIVLIALLSVAVFMTPALIRLVATRRFPNLERKKGATIAGSVIWSAVATVVALAALIVSSPLWLIPPLVLVLPPLIWGWLTYRVMAFDALSEHASREERKEIFAHHRYSLLSIGIICGFLGAAPSLVWASAVVFAAAFLVLIPVAIWIYTLVFAFSSLWFTHYCLAALEQLRAQRNQGAVEVPTNIVENNASTPALADNQPLSLPSDSGDQPGHH